jgi:hypothetical protein
MTLVCQRELPNVPGKSYAPGGYSPGHTYAKSAFIQATVLEGRVILSDTRKAPISATIELP